MEMGGLELTLNQRDFVLWKRREEILSKESMIKGKEEGMSVDIWEDITMGQIRK